MVTKQVKIVRVFFISMELRLYFPCKIYVKMDDFGEDISSYIDKYISSSYLKKPNSYHGNVNNS